MEEVAALLELCSGYFADFGNSVDEDGYKKFQAHLFVQQMTQ